MIFASTLSDCLVGVLLLPWSSVCSRGCPTGVLMSEPGTPHGANVTPAFGSS